MPASEKLIHRKDGKQKELEESYTAFHQLSLKKALKIL